MWYATAIKAEEPLTTGVVTGAAVVRINGQIGAGPITAPWLHTTALLIMLTFAARVFALGEGSAVATQTKDTARGRGSDGFEGLAA